MWTVVPGHEKANLGLKALMEDLDRRRRDLTTDYRSDNLLTMEHPAALEADNGIYRWHSGAPDGADILFTFGFYCAEEIEKN